MKIVKLLLLACILFQAKTITAQNYIGHTLDNYSGVHGILLNPSAVVDSRFRTDVNLFSVSNFLGSDYFSIDVDNLLSGEEGFDFESDVKVSPTDANNFFLNVDFLGPSFMFNLSKKSSIGVTTRVRAFFNLNNISGQLYESISNDFDIQEDFDFNTRNFSGTLHAWGELGVTYGRILMDKDKNFLKGGVTLKYLSGAGSAFFSAPSITGDYDTTAETLTTTGSMSYGSSMGFENEDIEFSNTSSGFGADIGLTYEYRPGFSTDSLGRKYNKYKFKLGVSLTDLGSISYDDSSVTTYDLNATIDAAEFENKDVETVLEENYTGTEEIVSRQINLPSALHIMADYQVRKRVYVSVLSSLSLISADKELSNRIINSVTLAPRFETRWFSFYSPISIRQYDGIMWGTGLRLGPLTVGSGSVLSNLISKETKTTDIYLGLKIPIYQ